MRKIAIILVKSNILFAYLDNLLYLCGRKGLQLYLTE